MQEQSLFTSQAQGITLSRYNELITQAINSTPGLQNQCVVFLDKFHIAMATHDTQVARLGNDPLVLQARC